MMLCPKCGGKTDVIDSRLNELYNSVRRRRKCKKCGYRFTTYEGIYFDKPKKDKVKEEPIKLKISEEENFVKKLEEIKDDFEDWEDEEDWEDVY